MQPARFCIAIWLVPLSAADLAGSCFPLFCIACDAALDAGRRGSIDAFAVTGDFVSFGRMSGAKGIPIATLETAKSHTVDGMRLQVNSSVAQSQNELNYLISIL